MTTPSLTKEELTRYSRQLIVKGWSEKKQLHLRKLQIVLPANESELLLYLVAIGFEQFAFWDIPQCNYDFFAHAQRINPRVELISENSISHNSCAVYPPADKKVSVIFSALVIKNCLETGPELVFSTNEETFSIKIDDFNPTIAGKVAQIISYWWSRHQ